MSVDVEESVPEAEPEAETDAINEEDWSLNATSEIVPEGEAWPEPGPEWSIAFDTWTWAWEMHVYGFSLMFGLISLISMLNLMCQDRKTIRKRVISICLTSLTILLGVTRTVSLIVNPYGSSKSVPLEMSRVLWSIGFPALTSGLSTLLLVLLDSTKMTLGPPTFQQIHTLLPVIVSHFVLVISVDILVATYAQVEVLLLVCQVLYIVWAGLLSSGFYIMAYKLHRNLKAGNVSKTTQGNRSSRLVKLVCCCATMGFTMCLTHLYGAFGVFGIYSDAEFVDAWPWWIYQTLLRLQEVLICFVMFALSAKRRDQDTPPHSSRLIQIILAICPGILSTTTNKVSNLEAQSTNAGESALNNETAT